MGADVGHAGIDVWSAWAARSAGQPPPGRDVWAISAVLVVEASERVLAGQLSAAGVVATGEAFDADDFLAALPVTRPR